MFPFQMQIQSLKVLALVRYWYFCQVSGIITNAQIFSGSRKRQVFEENRKDVKVLALTEFDEGIVRRANETFPDLEEIIIQPSCLFSSQTRNTSLRTLEDLVYTNEDQESLHFIEQHCPRLKTVLFTTPLPGRPIEAASLLSIRVVTYRGDPSRISSLPLLMPYLGVNPQITRLVLWSTYDINFTTVLSTLTQLKEFEVNDLGIKDNPRIDLDGLNARNIESTRLTKLMIAFHYKVRTPRALGGLVRQVLQISEDLKFVALENCQTWRIPRALMNSNCQVVLMDYRKVTCTEKETWHRHVISYDRSRNPMPLHENEIVDSEE